MYNTIVFLLSVGAAVMMSSCAREAPAMRTEATGASVSIKSEPSGKLRVQVQSQGATSVQTRTPAEVPPPPLPEKLPKRMGNSTDIQDFL